MNTQRLQRSPMLLVFFIEDRQDSICAANVISRQRQLQLPQSLIDAFPFKVSKYLEAVRATFHLSDSNGTKAGALRYYPQPPPALRGLTVWSRQPAVVKNHFGALPGLH
jgi:hypothetical protein